MSPQTVPKGMNTSEIKKEMVGATGFEPLALPHHLNSVIDSPPLPQSDVEPSPPSEIEKSPHSVPKAGPTVKRHKSNQGYATPQNFVRACEAKFSVRVLWDLAANEANTKAPYWISQEQDALTKGWGRLIHSRADVFWLNPPFDDIAPWAEKCAREAALGARILLLTPASIGSNWFRDHIMGKAMVLALNGRIQFVGASDPYPKDLMLSVFGIGVPSFHIWTLPKDARA